MVYEGRRPDLNTLCPNCGNIVSVTNGICLGCGYQLESTQEGNVAHIDSISGAISTVSDAARELVRDIRGEYLNFAGTFSPEQVKISHQIQFTENLEELDDGLETIETKMKELVEVVKSIAEQTREPTLWERAKASIFDNLIGFILAMLLGALLTWLGLNILF